MNSIGALVAMFVHLLGTMGVAGALISESHIVHELRSAMNHRQTGRATRAWHQLRWLSWPSYVAIAGTGLYLAVPALGIGTPWLIASITGIGIIVVCEATMRRLAAAPLRREPPDLPRVASVLNSRTSHVSWGIRALMMAGLVFVTESRGSASIALLTWVRQDFQ